MCAATSRVFIMASVFVLSLADGFGFGQDTSQGDADMPSTFGVGIGPVFLDSAFMSLPLTSQQFSSSSSYALVDIGSARAETNKSSLLSSKPQAHPFVLQAETAFRDGRYDVAQRWLQHALIEDPQNGLLELMTAQALFAMGEMHLAADSVLRAFARLPKHHWGVIVANHSVWYRDGEYAKQIAKLGELIRQHPQDSQLLFLRGYHLAFLGRADAATTDLQQAVAVNPQHRGAVELLTLLAALAPNDERALDHPPKSELLPSPRQ